LGIRSDLLEKAMLDLSTRGILKMQNPALGVSPLAPEIQFITPITILSVIKMDTEIHKLIDAGRPLRDHSTNNILVTKPGSRIECVANVKLK
jgi:hypothetical protein